MAFYSKRKRVNDEISDDICEVSDLNDKLISHMGKVVDALLLDPHTPPAVSLHPLKILNCNAANRYGVHFSKAFCSIDTDDKVFHFGEIFRRGLQVLVDFVSERKLPDNKLEKNLLIKLLQFIIKTDGMDMFRDIDKLKDTNLTTLVANHLFSKLSMSGDYIVDNNCTTKTDVDRCYCGKEDCKLLGSYGDTSIGNSEVWHGNVEIILNNNIGVTSISEEEEIPGGKSSFSDDKTKSTILSANEQIIAEAIVFSFLQKKRRPDKSHFLTPCVGVGRSEMIVMFYDAENDVLLESTGVPLMESVEKEMSKFTLQAVIVAWLVVNFEYLCNGLTYKLKNAVKADFFNQVETKIDTYENDLKYRNVGSCNVAPVMKKLHASDGSPSNFIIDLHVKIVKSLYKKPATQSCCLEDD